MIKGHTLLEAKGRENNWSHSRDRGKERESNYRVVSETGEQVRMCFQSPSLHFNFQKPADAVQQL